MTFGAFRLNTLSSAGGGALPPSYFYNILSADATNNRFLDSAIDVDGNLYLVGNYTANERGLIFKYNSQGVLQWQKAVSTNYVLRCISIDSNNNIYIGGSDESASPTKGLLIKINSDGTINWQKNFGSATESPSIAGIAVSSSGNISCVGKSNSGGYGNFMFARFDSSGTLLTSKIYYDPTYTINNYHDFYDCSVDSSGNTWAVGRYNSGSYNFVTALKLDTNGNIQYTRLNRCGAMAAYIQFISSEIDSAGNVIIGGLYFDSNSQRYMNSIMKTNSSGTIDWNIAMTSSSGSVGSACVTVDKSNNIYVASEQGPLSDECYISKFNSSGTLLWNRKIDATNIQKFNNINFRNNTVYALGSTTNASTTDMNPMLWAVPDDGSKTGTYGSFTYSTGGLTTQNISDYSNPSGYSLSSKSGGFTAGNSSAAFTNTTMTSTTTNL